MTDKSEKSAIVSADQLRQLALELINNASTMTLATSGSCSAWAAPVYYVFLSDRFYFFSKPDSRHIQESLAGGYAAAAIHAHAESWQHIRGVQMSGMINNAQINLNAISAVKAYLKKFPFTKSLFEDDQNMGIDDFFDCFKVKLYYFTPDLIYYQDNQIRFGYREAVIL
jgi:uncharacterized protein YhbP (UPF0306 family)